MDLETILPQCPINKEIEGKNLKVCDMVVYGIHSNNCAECVNADKFCDIYKRWYFEGVRKGYINFTNALHLGLRVWIGLF